MRLSSKTTRFVAIGASLAGFSVPGVLGWGAAGHGIVATIAQIYTDSAALEKLCAILEPDTDAGCSLADVSTWADRIRPSKPWSAPWHYVNPIGDHPADTCLFPSPRGWDGKPGDNILGAIRNTTSILLDWTSGENRDLELAQEALKFMVHFVGDMHMPFHLIGRDRGGNGVDVCWNGKRTNLHSAWDGDVVEKAIRATGRNYSQPLPGLENVENNLRGENYDPYIRRIIWEGLEGKWVEDWAKWIGCPSRVETKVWSTLRDFFLPGWTSQRVIELPATDTAHICPQHWAKPIHALNCELVWPKAIDEGRPPSRDARCRYYELNNPDYMDPIEERMLVEQFLAQGGLRLAFILNHVFADQSKVDHIRA